MLRSNSNIIRMYLGHISDISTEFIIRGQFEYYLFSHC